MVILLRGLGESGSDPTLSLCSRATLAMFMLLHSIVLRKKSNSRCKFIEAFEENIKEIRKQFGNKNDKGIAESRSHFLKEVLPKLQKQFEAKKGN